MFHSWQELSKWLNMSIFEILMFVWASILFTILLPLKIDNPFNFDPQTLTWWHIFSPYFLYDALASYFNVIIFIRQFQTGRIRLAFIRLICMLTRISMYCLVKIFLISKFDNKFNSGYSEIFLPLFLLFLK
ncbi:hypothetical protein QR98_0053920 [Sarcoptes scabiei]|uniref:Uncharacterized protein n=1 Tax=Sarcoptes scabiei TaxID=52283 RepID=A0A132A7G1_SARSC|nr:hypothetical protein QR98_0053920 [Sarcoptes scabiei]